MCSFSTLAWQDSAANDCMKKIAALIRRLVEAAWSSLSLSPKRDRHSRTRLMKVFHRKGAVALFA
jgi:hypothetical protein